MSDPSFALMRLLDSLPYGAEILRDVYDELRAEIARLTRELDEARETANRLRSSFDKLVVKGAEERRELESRLAWHKVSEKPPEHRQRVLAFDGERVLVAFYHSDEYGFTGAQYFEAPTHWREIGPLPAAPNEAGK